MPPVVIMQETSWDDTRLQIGNGPAELSGGAVSGSVSQDARLSGSLSGAARSQDDARVGYMFQRPQAQALANPVHYNKRWGAAMGPEAAFVDPQKVRVFFVYTQKVKVFLESSTFFSVCIVVYVFHLLSLLSC